MKHSKNIIISKVKFTIESCFRFHKWKTWLFNGNNHKYTIVTKWHAVFLAYTTGKDFTNLSSIDHFRYIKIHTWLRNLGNKSKEMYFSLLSLKMISFFFFPEPCSQIWILIYQNWSLRPLIWVSLMCTVRLQHWLTPLIFWKIKPKINV